MHKTLRFHPFEHICRTNEPRDEDARTTLPLCKILFLVLIANAAVAPTKADVVPWPPDSPSEIWIVGQIQRGDEVKFEMALREAGGRIRTVVLNTPGGDVPTAMMIGRLVRRLYLGTQAPSTVVPSTGIQFLLVPDKPGASRIRAPNDVHARLDDPTREMLWSRCSSAGVLIWLAGVKRSGDLLGVHRPYFDPSWFADLTAEEAGMRYEAMIGQVRAYLKEMGAPATLFDRMLAVASDDTRYDPALAEEIGEEAPFLSEWLIAKCGPGYQRHLHDLAVAALAGKEPSSASVAREFTAMARCRGSALMDARAQAFKMFVAQ